MSEYQCAAMVWAERAWNISGLQCERPGVNEAPFGKWYCADHSPKPPTPIVDTTKDKS